MKITDAIRERLHEVRDRIAYAIQNSDWATLGWNVAFVLAIVLVAVASGVGILALVWKVLGPLLGKIFTGFLVLFILGLSLKDALPARQKIGEPATLDEWADNIYYYVLDALFLALRAVSEYSNIVTPSRASAIELTDEPYTIEDGYVVFNFFGKTCGPIDTTELKKDLQYTLQQLHRAHELNGISRDLVEINGSYYCPLQILGTQDLSDHVQISVVFATEKTVEMTRARKLLNLDHALQARRKQGKANDNDTIFR